MKTRICTNENFIIWIKQLSQWVALYVPPVVIDGEDEAKWLLRVSRGEVESDDEIVSRGLEIAAHFKGLRGLRAQIIPGGIVWHGGTAIQLGYVARMAECGFWKCVDCGLGELIDGPRVNPVCARCKSPRVEFRPPVFAQATPAAQESPCPGGYRNSAKLNDL